MVRLCVFRSGGWHVRFQPLQGPLDSLQWDSSWEGGGGVPRWQNWQWLEKRGSGGWGGARDDIYNFLTPSQPCRLYQGEEGGGGGGGGQKGEGEEVLGGGGKIVLNAQSTMTVVSGRRGGECWGGGKR